MHGSFAGHAVKIIRERAGDPKVLRRFSAKCRNRHTDASKHDSDFRLRSRGRRNVSTSWDVARLTLEELVKAKDRLPRDSLCDKFCAALKEGIAWLDSSRHQTG